jgi:hypothetical protein
MCEIVTPGHPKPCWGALYTIAATSVGLVAATQSITVLVWRAAVSVVLLLAATAASLAWVRGNRVALDQREWCACAGASVSVRVVGEPATLLEDVDCEEVAARIPPPSRGATLVV